MKERKEKSITEHKFFQKTETRPPTVNLLYETGIVLVLNPTAEGRVSDHLSRDEHSLHRLVANPRQ